MTTSANRQFGAIEEAWEKRSGPAVFATADREGLPNAVYVGAVWKYGSGRFLIADNYFSKTGKNIAQGSKGSLLFITGEGKSYQLKGSLSVHREGEIFNTMKQWNDPKYPGVAAVALDIEEAYSGAEKLI